MSRASLSSVLRRASVLLVLGAAGLGCGGLGPGDYAFFRVAVDDQVKKSSGCFGTTGVPANEKSDKTTFHTNGLFIIYGAVEEAEEKLFLDMGETTVEGYEEAELFTFTGSSTDIDFTEINGGGDKHTVSNKLVVELTIDGSSMVGTAEQTTKQTCSGSTCNLTMPTPITCTTTTSFVGTEVDSVELTHEID